MDPVTATSLVLGVIPLIVSALENYDTVCQTFETFRKYVKETNRFTAKLSTQRTVFYNQCQILLSTISPGQKLEHILKDLDHPDRDDDELNQRLERLLGSSFETCVATLQLIGGILHDIQHETRDFNDVGKETPSLRKRLLVFRQRLKMSFSRSRLEAVVDELRQHNSDLVTLTSQIRDLGVQHQAPKSTYLVTHNMISHFRTTRQALRKLHSLLAGKWACDDGVQHEANLSLMVLGAEGCQELSSVVRFHLVLTCQPRPMLESSPVWLDIESVPVESQKPEIYDSKAMVSVRAALQSIVAGESAARSPPPGHSNSPGDFRIKATLSESSSTQNSSENSHATAQALIPFPRRSSGTDEIPQTLSPFVNLSGLNRLCKYFHEQLRDSLEPEAHMVFLEEATNFKHFVYLKPSSHALSPRKTSLKDVLQGMSTARRRGSLCTKLQLARLLSLGILRFTSTPWLEETWSSSDIQFFELGENSGDILRKTPCFTTPLCQQKILGLNTAPKQNSPEVFIPNTTLFSLGVVLLELGYDAPLHALQCEEDLREGKVTEYTKFLTAQRLGRKASQELGMRYGKIIQRCLRCDFGFGEDLESVELQKAVVSLVVDELELCLKAQAEVDAILFPVD